MYNVDPKENGLKWVNGFEARLADCGAPVGPLMHGLGGVAIIKK